MRNAKLFLIGMLAMALVVGMTGCKQDADDDGGGNENIIGTYTGSMNGQNFTLTVTNLNWTISAASFSDSGTYILNGNTATLISNTGNAYTETTEVGTATINENTITIVLNSRSWFPGTYTATKTGTSSGDGENNGNDDTGSSDTAEAFTSLAEALAYLDSQPTGGINATNPVLLKLNVNLSDSTEGWYALVTALASKNKYVALDLSDSGVTDEKFDSGINGADKVRAKIVSLVLPDCATSIVGGSTKNPAVYANLKTVSGANITSIGTIFSGCKSLTTASFPAVTSVGGDAFRNCTSLTSVSFPNATSIGYYALYDCTSLSTIYAPKAVVSSFFPHGFSSLIAVTVSDVTDIANGGNSAFYGCTNLVTVSLLETTSVGNSAFSSRTSLTTVSFPKVTSIGNSAFVYCTSLTSVSFPEVTSIGYGAFASSGTTPLTITMGAAAPTVSYGMFSGINGSRTVTVRVPSGATGYDEAWQEAFKGYGNDGSGHGTVNENINLVVEYY
jgi:hypothetical protein